MTMRRILPWLAASLVGFAAVSAQAASPADGDFSGLYVGLDAGVTGANAKFALPGDMDDALQQTKDNTSSATGGALIGYNHQMGDWVLGVEADITAQHNQLNVTACTIVDGCFVTTHDSFTTYNHLNQSTAGRARVRFGKVIGGTLVYAAAGYSAERTRLDLVGYCFNAGNPTVPLIFNFSRGKTVSGFNLGAGVERSLGGHFAARGELIWDDYGSQTYAGAAPEWNDRRIGLHDLTLRAALTYRF